MTPTSIVDHEHTFRRSGYTGDGAEGFTIIDWCTVCRAERRRPATEEEASGIRQEWADRDELHAVFHAFCKATDGLSGFDLMEAAEGWAATHPDRVRLVTVDDSPHHSSSYLVFVTHENAKEFMGTTVLFVPQLSGNPTEFFLYPSHHQQLAETLAWLEARAKAKPGMFEVAMAAAQARKDRP